MERFIATVSRGKYKGECLYPYKNSDNKYVVSLTRFKIDQIYLDTEDELEAFIALGYGVRMHNRAIPRSPSLISAGKIEILQTQARPDAKNRLLKSFLQTSMLDSDTISKQRKEQAFLRSFLTDGALVAECTICGDKYPIDFLVAAHIKKRAECSHEEKLDMANIATLMCKTGCDDLFEKGYIYVNHGSITKNKNKTCTPSLEKLIDKITGNKVANWMTSKHYYEYHAKKVNK